VTAQNAHSFHLITLLPRILLHLAHLKQLFLDNLTTYMAYIAYLCNVYACKHIIFLFIYKTFYHLFLSA
jgi:hypothetical protein